MSFQKGEIILRHDGRYPEDALVVDGYESGALHAHPLGGGFQLMIPAGDQGDFTLVSEPEQTPIFRSAMFELEGLEGQFAGWTDGASWNGWAMPRFGFTEALRLISALGAAGRYAREHDAFVTPLADDETEIWEAQMIALPDGGCVKCYAIGAGSWIWEESGGEAS